MSTRATARFRRSTVSAIALLSIAALAACGSSGGSTADSSGKKFTIGLITPSTGTLAPNGQGNKAGFDFYWKQHKNEAAGRQISVLHSDEGTPAQAVSNTQELVNQKKVDVVAGFVSSASALAARDVTERAKVPLVVIQAASNGLSDDTNRDGINVQLGATFEQGFGAITKHAIDKGVKKIVFLGSDYQAGKDSAAAVKSTAEANGAKVIKSIYAPLGTQDFGPFLGNIPSDADAAIVFFGGTDASRFVQQYNEFGLKSKLPLYAYWSLTVDPLLSEEGAAAEGITTFQEYTSTIDNPTNAQFVKDWTAETGTAPNPWNAQGYIAAQVIATALEDTDGKGTGAELGKAIRAVKVDSPIGRVSFNANGGIVQPVSYAVVKKNPSGDGYINAVLPSTGDADKAK